MRCNWWRWLWGIVPLLVLSWVAVQAEHGRVEGDLTGRSGAMLAQSGLGWAIVEFKGRDAMLTGRAPREGEPAKAGDALARMWGVRVVDNRAVLLDKAENYYWTASRHNNRIRLRGYSPTAGTRQAILGVAKASFPGFEVIDRTTLARGVPFNDVWLAGVSFALKQLTSLKRGEVRLDDMGLTITGEAEDLAAYRAVKQALASGVPKGIKMVGDNMTAPAVSPYTWGARLANGRLLLSGHVPSDAVRAQVVAAAKASLPSASVLDQMEPAAGAPQGWAEAVVASLREIGRLEGGAAEMKDGVLVVSGVAANGAMAEAIRAGLRTALPAAIKLTDQIRVKEVPPPSPPPMPEAASPPVRAPPPPSAPPSAPREPEPAVAINPEPAKPSAPPAPPAALPSPAPPAAAPAPAPPAAAMPAAPPEVVVKAKACEEQLTSLADAGQIHFRVGSANLDSLSIPTLNRLAEAANSCPDMSIEVSGHTSAEGGQQHNQQLSLRRAQSVVSYLVRAGVEASRLQSAGYGASRPAAPNDSDANMAKNRRIEFTVRPR